MIWVLIWLIGSFAGDLWRFQETKERKGKKKRRWDVWREKDRKGEEKKVESSKKERMKKEEMETVYIRREEGNKLLPFPQGAKEAKETEEWKDERKNSV